MLYGPHKIQKIILDKVADVEKERNIKVIFGAMVGSISKGLEREDSDYDTRFLYLEPDEDGSWKRYDKANYISEKDVHFSYIPDDQTLFYDKIAFWEASSFINYLSRPVLDEKESNGLYHIVGWTFFSPYVWDPYNILGRVSAPITDLFDGESEISYYRSYITKAFTRDKLYMREYLYSAYYALAIEYCMKRKTFAPVYFPTLLLFDGDNDLYDEIKSLTKDYYCKTDLYIKENTNFFRRKMGNGLFIEKRYKKIDEYIEKVMKDSQHLFFTEKTKVGNTSKIVDLIIDTVEKCDNHKLRFESIYE